MVYNYGVKPLILYVSSKWKRNERMPMVIMHASHVHNKKSIVLIVFIPDSLILWVCWKLQIKEKNYLVGAVLQNQKKRYKVFVFFFIYQSYSTQSK